MCYHVICSQCLCFYFVLLFCTVSMHLTRYDLMCFCVRFFYFLSFGASVYANKDVYVIVIILVVNLFCAYCEWHPACKKLELWGTGVVICLERGADLHMVQLMPLPLTVSCFSKIQIDFTYLVPAHPGSPGKRAVKQVCVSLFA